MRGAREIAAGLFCVWMLTVPFSVSSFALRGLAKGDKVPDIEHVGISGEGGKLSSFLGEKGLVVLYWATWSSRSPAILEFAEKELRRYEKNGIRFLAINVEHQEMRNEDIEAIRKHAADMRLSFPVVLDAGLRGYNEVGVISVPTTVILDKELRIVDAYPGFPSIARNEIPDRLDAFLGIEKEKRPEKSQYLLDHTPKNNALMYYNLGKNLFLLARSPSGSLRAVPENAIERLDEAIRRDPDFFRPYLLKAIIFDMAGDGAKREAALQELKKGDFQEVYEWRVLGFGYLFLGMDALASDYFQLLSSQLPEDPGVLFGEAVAEAKRRNTDASRKALEALRKTPGASETLGFDFSPLFTGDGELAPGTERQLAQALGMLLEIEKKPEGRIRKDAPVQPVQAADLSAPAAAPGEKPPQPAAGDGPK